jgi:hypothetical protein
MFVAEGCRTAKFQAKNVKFVHTGVKITFQSFDGVYNDAASAVSTSASKGPKCSLEGCMQATEMYEKMHLKRQTVPAVSESNNSRLKFD